MAPVTVLNDSPFGRPGEIAHDEGDPPVTTGFTVDIWVPLVKVRFAKPY